MKKRCLYSIVAMFCFFLLIGFLSDCSGNENPKNIKGYDVNAVGAMLKSFNFEDHWTGNAEYGYSKDYNSNQTGISYNVSFYSSDSFEDVESIKVSANTNGHNVRIDYSLFTEILSQTQQECDLNLAYDWLSRKFNLIGNNDTIVGNISLSMNVPNKFSRMLSISKVVKPDSIQ